jgi:short-subunit dehydrogenase
MKNVYLTGHTGGIGSAIARQLSSDGYRVIPISSRLENTCELETEIAQLRQSTPPDVLIHAAGFGLFGPHEELRTGDIERMVAVNLTAPVILANLCLRDLKARQGHIIHIGSIEALRSARWSALYSATKGGLRHFSLTLYEEVRKAGVKVTCIHPDLVRTNFFDGLRFCPADGEEYALAKEEVATAVREVLSHAGVISELTIRPLKLGICKKHATETDT